MGASPLFGIPLIASQQAQPEVTHNEAVMLLSIAMRGALSIGDTSPPGSPAEGDCYVLGASPTGAWSGKGNKIAIYYNAAWNFLPGVDESGTNIPIGASHEGLKIYVQDENTDYIWDGSAWRVFISGAGSILSFSPTFDFVTPGDLSVLYSQQTGEGSIIGNMFFARIRLSFTPTYTTASGIPLIVGLPFSNASSFTQCATMTFHNANLTYPAGVTEISPNMNAGNNFISMRGNGSGVTSRFLSPTEVPSGVGQTWQMQIAYPIS